MPQPIAEKIPWLGILAQHRPFFRRIAGRNDADDAMQDCAVRLLKSKHRAEQVTSALLRKIAHDQNSDRLRSSRKHRDDISLPHEGIDHSFVSHDCEILEPNITQVDVRLDLEHIMSPTERHVFDLRTAGFKVREIASEMGLSEDVVQRVWQKLRHKAGGYRDS